MKHSDWGKREERLGWEKKKQQGKTNHNGKRGDEKKTSTKNPKESSKKHMTEGVRGRGVVRNTRGYMATYNVGGGHVQIS